ncbi:MAG: hypothetical protein GY807_13330 [Gammaproteobacteria bacterium]|nr:hypothetical protein [Gammaproteobacteria bacterium]
MLSLDPNQVIWDASAIFAPSWESATLTRMTLNPNEYLDNDPDTQDIIITVSGKIDISATQDFLSLDTRSPVVCQAIDDKGMNVGLRIVHEITSRFHRDCVPGMAV